MSADRYRFLDPWWLLLPDGGSALLAVAGSGGRSTLLRRLCAHYRERGRTVLWTQSSAQPAPVDLPHHLPQQQAEIARSLREKGAAYVAGPADPQRLHGALSDAQIQQLRTTLRPDIVLVDAHARCQRALRADGVRPSWPTPTHIALLVAPLSAVGRVYGPESVAGVSEVRVDAEGRPRRIDSDDIAAAFLDSRQGLLAELPEGALPLPFLCGFGSYRDIDGMFELVQKLWAAPGVRAVCLAELLGDERRDAADLRDLLAGPQGDAPLSGERIYALYPSELDER